MHKKVNTFLKKIALLTTSFLFIFSCLSGCGLEPAPAIEEPEVIIVEPAEVG